jgi:hypothetical protein
MLRSVPFFVVLLVGAVSANADFIINGNNGSGFVRASGGFNPSRLIVGISTSDHNYNGIAVFTLPTLAANEVITGAALSFVTSNNGTIFGGNVDLWSLGTYSSVNLSNSAYYTSMFRESNADPTAGRVKLADDFITSGTNVFGTKQTNATTNALLASTLQAIYDNDPNAAGKLFAIRLNSDQPTANISGGFRLYGGNEGASNAPKLSLTTEVVSIPTPASIALLAPAALAWMRRRR